MLDFFIVATSMTKNGIDIYPKFIVRKSKDLMIKGNVFYAIWDEEAGFWSRDEYRAFEIIDREITNYANQFKETSNTTNKINVKYLRDGDSGQVDKWNKYCKFQSRDNYHDLDERIIFNNEDVRKEDYATRKLNYPIEEGEPEAWNKLVGTLYSPDEKHKIEWIIGAIASGASKTLQKFAVFYGSSGTGKSTVLNIINGLFAGYCANFEAKTLGLRSAAFALEAFANNPLVAINHDGDLSRIEDNTRLNSLVSHEELQVNEKFKHTYTNKFHTFLLMGTNEPVKITNAKSGILRRLIDISPSGEKVSFNEYNRLMGQMKFEYGKIVNQCLEVYHENHNYYDKYIPINMMSATNDFYDFVEENAFDFAREEYVTLKSAWEKYKSYCDNSHVSYMKRITFKEELKNYFEEYKDRLILPDGTNARKVFLNFKMKSLEKSSGIEEVKVVKKLTTWLDLKEQPSLLDIQLADCPAQYANEEEKPMYAWSRVKTTLKAIDTSKTHYVRVPENHIVIDFDIRDKDGNKSLDLNIKAANKFPRTYSETSKSGGGLHLHYLYSGDVSMLSQIYDEGVEVKVFTGKQSLRRRLTICNDIPIATISSGLPLKGAKPVEDYRIENERQIRRRIMRCLNKEIHPDTTSNINFIFETLENAYKSGIVYDVTDLRDDVCAFAAGSTHQSEGCLKKALKMKFKSDDVSDVSTPDGDLVFFDIEVFPNLFLVNYKKAGDNPVIRMINPRPIDIENLIKHKLVGFNCRKYDNHLIYARLMGYSNEALYDLSQRIINKGDKDCFFSDAYGLSYTDVYDFCSKKQSLKKWEIELGIHHVELNLPWDEPVPENLWDMVAEYCDNDVIATEAVFNERYSDFKAREILADLSGLTVNDTNNQHTTRIIFGGNKEPQSQFNYRFMGVDEGAVNDILEGFPAMNCDKHYTVFKDNKPVFPGYTYSKSEKGVWESWYRGELIGEGGYVYAEPGIYYNVALLDVASMHPHSIKAENLFGDEYTQKFVDLLDVRIYIKHGEYDKVREMFDGKLSKYLDDKDSAKALSNALKIPINSVYGLTSAKFRNPFKDPRNIDNIVAKRGALFMVNLKHEVQARGFTVAHIKTDSIKIPNATPEIIQFVSDYGKMYGYTFEHEATYEKMALVNNAVYIARYADPDICKMQYGYAPKDNVEKREKHDGWTATGKEFAEPYVFKTLFSHEPIDFYDMGVTVNVNSSLYLDMNENLPDVSDSEKELLKIKSVMNKVKNNEDTSAMGNLPLKYRGMSEKELSDQIDILKNTIDQGHDYKFIGRVGSFMPVTRGGGKLVRKTDDGYAFAAGTKDYRWLDTESVKALKDKGEDIIDISYYRQLVDDSYDNILQFGDFFKDDDGLPF
ncbi:MAG: hypothetical protein J6U54_24255 [Clostridiales bacterium]|nr:hypothetical protein [Clostridiales bacterium]